MHLVCLRTVTAGLSYPSKYYFWSSFHQMIQLQWLAIYSYLML